jgi:GTPase
LSAKRGGRQLPERSAGRGSSGGGGTRAGFVGVAGRPNVGKSTLVNAIVGTKVAIISDRPQTTRRAVRGVATDLDAGWQMVLVDLPGVQRPRDVLTERMQRRVEAELEEADAVLMVVNGEQGLGPGDRFIARHLLAAGREVPVICAVNKIDRLTSPETARTLSDAAELEAIDELFPVSAKRGTGLGVLTDRLAELMPEGAFLYPPSERSDQPSELHLAELIREQVLRRTREEIPHAVEVAIGEIETRDDGLVEVTAQIWAESESQKGILIGKGGRMVREVGTAARRELERELGAQVFLDLQVRVRERWRRDEALLDRLGIE